MSRLRANALLLLAAIVWGTTFVVQQVGTGGLEAITFTGVRMLVGTVFILPAALVQLRKINGSSRPFQISDWVGIFFTGMSLFVAAALQQQGIFFTTVTNASFLTVLYVPLVPVISLLVLRRRSHWSVWPAAVCSVIGTYIMTGVQQLNLQVGDLFVIGSSLFWAIQVILVGRFAVRTGAPLVVACGQFLVCGVIGTIAGMIIEQPVLADFSGALLGILYAGLFSVGVGFTLQVVAQRHTHEADAAIILSSETVFAACAGFIFLGERLSLSQTLGALLILTGILAVQLLPKQYGQARPLDPVSR
ncbi:MAG: DMT family transporter [Desulfocapsaceae bacterium]|jgi:drug/metabolite transporter (DMT)-like permease|nr:DMT family transporter [Desulfocapsaceae bacterium]